MLIALLAGVVTVAVWRVQDGRERGDRLEHTSALATALEHARAQLYLEAAATSALLFIEDPALAQRSQLAAADLRLDLSQARAEMIASGKADELAALDGLSGQVDAIQAEIDTAMPFFLAGDQGAILALASTRWPELWPSMAATIDGLEALAQAAERELAAGAAAENHAADATLWLVIGFGAAAFLVAAGGAVLVLSVVRPLAALRAKARAITAGSLQVRAEVSGPEEVASLARDFNEMTHALLAKSEEYIATTNLTGDLIAKLDAQGRWAFLNDAACQFFGRPREELLGTDARASLHPEDLEPTAQAVQQAGATREPMKGFVNRQVTPLGTRVVEWNAYPIFDEEGQYAGIQMTGRDITERRRAEEALRESEERFRQVAETSRGWIWEVDAEGHYTYSSPAVKDILGYEPEEVIGKYMYDHFAPEDRRELLTQARETRAGKGTFVRRVQRKVHKDGHTVVVESTGLPILDADGNLVGYRCVDQDVTERKRAEEALRESEKKYRDLVEKATVGIGVTRQGKFAFCNRKEGELFGYEDPSGLCGRSVTEVIHPDDLARLLRLGEQTKLGEAMTSPVTFRGIRCDGSEVVLEGLAIQFPFEGKDALLSFHTDVTERKRTEEALRESEERFRQVAETAREWIWEFDADGHYTYSCPAVKDILGYEPEEIVGKHFLRFVVPEDTERVLRRAKEVSASEGPFLRVMVRKVHKDGHTVVVESTGLPILDAEGRLLGYRGADQDVTERRQAEEALHESEERFRTLFEFAPDGYYLQDFEGSLVDGNKAAEEITGYRKEELIGRTIIEVNLLPPEQLPRAAASLAKSLLGLPAGPDEFTLIRKDGTQAEVETRTFPVKIRGKGLLLGIARDISERKRTEEQLQKIRDELESRVERRMQQVNGYGLTFREVTVLHLVAAGESDKEIATVLGISPLTAHKHLANILEKMGAASRTEAGVRALREGLLH
jgi:PAS domain S-box-containing protein